MPASSSSSYTKDFYEPRIPRTPAQPPMARMPPGFESPDSPDSVPLARLPPDSGTGTFAQPPVARLPPGMMPVPAVVNTARLPPGFENPPSTILPPPPPLRDDDDDEPVLSPFQGPIGIIDTTIPTTSNNTTTNNNDEVPSMSAFFTKAPRSTPGSSESVIPSMSHFLPPARLPRSPTGATPSSTSASGIGRSLSTTRHHLPPALTPRIGAKKPGGGDGAPSVNVPTSRMPMVSGIDYDDITGSFTYDDSNASQREQPSSTNNNNMVPDNFKNKMPESSASRVPESEVTRAYDISVHASLKLTQPYHTKPLFSHQAIQKNLTHYDHFNACLTLNYPNLKLS